MADFLTAKGAVSRLEQIISEANKRLVLISPYLDVSDLFLQRLQDAARRQVPISFVHRKESLKPEAHERLKGVPSLRLLFLKSLHAKCYFNEVSMVITSMNLYEASEANREMGVYLTAGEPAFDVAVREAESIMASATAGGAQPTGPNGMFGKSSGSAVPRKGHAGHCIRCRQGVPLNADRPLCIDCYDVWAGFSNPDYQELCCHACGREARTSMSRPLCRSCYATSSAGRPLAIT